MRARAKEQCGFRGHPRSVRNQCREPRVSESVAHRVKVPHMGRGMDGQEGRIGHGAVRPRRAEEPGRVFYLTEIAERPRDPFHALRQPRVIPKIATVRQALRIEVEGETRLPIVPSETSEMRLGEGDPLPVAEFARQRETLLVERTGASRFPGMVERLTQVAEDQRGSRHIGELPPEGETLLVVADRLPGIVLEKGERAETGQDRGDAPCVGQLARHRQRLREEIHGLAESFLGERGVAEIAERGGDTLAVAIIAVERERGSEVFLGTGRVATVVQRDQSQVLPGARLPAPITRLPPEREGLLVTRDRTGDVTLGLG